MSSILRISEAANLGIHALVYLSPKRDEAPIPASAIARALQASESHLAKVMQRLVAAGFVASIRGARGGFALLADPETTSLLDVYEAIDGPLLPSGCLLGRSSCLVAQCWLAGLEVEALHLVREHLGRATLAEVTAHGLCPDHA